MTDEMKMKLEGHLDQMLEDGIIRPSSSEWASCPVFAKKKGTTELRLCLDYRQVNTQIQGDAYPLPLLVEPSPGGGTPSSTILRWI